MIDYGANGGTWGSWGSVTSGGNALDGPLVPSMSVSGQKVRITDIIDGSSNTLLAGEKWLDGNAVGGLGTSCNDDQGYVDGWDNDAIVFANGQNGAGLANVVTPTQILPGVPNSCGLTFGSIHSGGCVTVFCDGSVHIVAFTINGSSWQRLCSRNDNLPTDFTDVN